MITLPPKSASGFTYDSINVPSSPAIGQTWRERDSFGRVKDDWLWIGALWISLQQRTAKSANNFLGGTTGFEDPFDFNPINYGVLIKRLGVIARVQAATSPGGAVDSSTRYWDFSLDLTNNGAPTGQALAVVSNQGKTYASQSNMSRQVITNIYLPTGDPEQSFPRGWYYQATAVNNPAFLFAASFSVDFHLVRKDLSPGSEVTAYVNAVIAAGGTVAGNTRTALNTLVDTLKAAGIWAKLAFLWVCLPTVSTLSAGSLYLKPYGLVDRMTLFNFTISDFDIDGLIGSPFASRYADTGIPLSVCSTTAMTLGVYDHSAAMDLISIGALTTTGNVILSSGNTAIGGAFWDCGDSASNRLSASNPTSKGLTIGTLSGTTSSLYRDKTLLATRTIPSNTFASSPNTLYAWAWNNGGAAGNFSNHRMSMLFAYNQASMTTLERDVLYDAYITYCAAIGRTT